jgi:probable HAF family extracellular repeat protein
MLLRPFLIVLALGGICAGQRTYTITDLGTLGGATSGGGAINNLGQVTGYSENAAGEQRAFIYDSVRGMVEIGNLGANRSLGTGINSRGQVAAIDLTAAPTAVVGVLYTAPNQVIRLLPPSVTQSESRAINNPGQVAGSSQFTPGGPYRAFRYTPGSGIVDLDPGSGSSSGWSINNFGTVTGGAATALTTSSAVVYPQGAGRTFIGTLGTYSIGLGINDLGQVVGGSRLNSGLGHAFLYTPGSGMGDLGTLPAAPDSTAYGINNAGEVVGRSGDRAFLYSQAGGMVDLNARIPSGSGWHLTTASAINDLGQITGNGSINGQSHAFLLTPVETPIFTGATRFVPVAPCRLLDTRTAGPAVAGGSIRRFPLRSGTCNIAPDATSYSLNVTVVPRGTLNYLTIWPSGRAQPNVSTLNSLDGRIKANAAIVPAGLGGAVDVFASETADVVLDVNGYFVPVCCGNFPTAGRDDLSYHPIVPCRVADTRFGTGPLGTPGLAARETRTIPVVSSQCGIPPWASAYSLNFTSVPAGPLSYLTTWPTGSPQPVVSTLNAPTGTITANAAIVPAGTNGSIDVFVTDPSHLVIDVNGYFGPARTPTVLWFYALPPCRAVDTRIAGGAMGASELRQFALRSTACGVPMFTFPVAYSLNATVVPRTTLPYLTLSAPGPLPLASTLNAFDGAITSNAAFVPADIPGTIQAYVANSSDLILDINGYFASPYGPL